MNKKPIIYIAGKVTGTPIHATTTKFGEAQKKLEAKGFEVINPLVIVSEKGNGWHTDWQTAMRLCLIEMMKADAVYLLPDWKDSRGAKIEKQLADDLELFNTDSLFCLTKHFEK
jgi:hypothetical protein